MDEETEEKGFVIKDRRIFSEGGEGKGEQSATEESDRSSEEEKTKSSPKERSEPGSANAQSSRVPEIDFAGFIISLYTSAAVHLGEMTDPATGKQEKNLPAAKQMIDIISLLKDKTQGNLDDNEAQLIEGLLYELRMRYVKEK